MNTTVVGEGGVELIVDEHGQGDPPLVLVHGFTGGRLDFADVVEPLAASRRVVTYDHRGHADSGHANGISGYSFDLLTIDLGHVVADRLLAPMHLLGHSMGGVVALRYVLAHPDHVRSLILMDTMAAPAAPMLAALMEGVVTLGRDNGMAAVADLLSNLMEHLPAFTTPERAEVSRARMRRKMSTMDVDVFAALGQELSTFPSLVDRLGEIACPVTVLVGEHDAGLRDSAEVLAKGIEGAELEVIAGAGHSPQEDDPAAWLKAVEAHLTRAGRDA